MASKITTDGSNSGPIPRIRLLCIMVALVSGVAGCSSGGGFVSVEEKFSNGERTSGNQSINTGSRNTQSGSNYTVRRGDTLYSIAWRYGVDHLTLARVNGIRSPYTIYPGQKIDIRSARGSGRVNQSPASNQPSSRPASKPAVVASKAPQPVRVPSQNSPGAPSDSVSFDQSSWNWPANGKILARFSTKEPVNKGIDISGVLGDSVKAAAAGTVVYAGQGLRGYGNLVIVKHDDAYLSAYAHTSRILVSEQQVVKAGQKIAEKGSTGTDEVKLHFEIRKNGKPVDPLKYLPKR